MAFKVDQSRQNCDLVRTYHGLCQTTHIQPIEFQVTQRNKYNIQFTRFQQLSITMVEFFTHNSAYLVLTIT